MSAASAAPDPRVVRLCSTFERGIDEAQRSGLDAPAIYGIIGTLIGYAAANHPAAGHDEVRRVIELVVSVAWNSAELRLDQRQQMGPDAGQPIPPGTTVQ